MNIVTRYFSELGIPAGYCEYYTHCMTFPCPDPRNVLLKNHDFQGDIPYLDGYVYFIQIRHPYQAIQSWYDINLIASGLEPSQENFDRFLCQKLNFYKNFCNKWMSFPQIKMIAYEKLFSDPFAHAKRVIDSLTGEQTDPALLRSIVRVNSPWPRHPATHPYFQMEALERIEKEFQELLVKLGIDLIADKIREELPALRQNNFFVELQAAYKKNFLILKNAGKKHFAEKEALIIQHSKEIQKYKQMIEELNSK